MSLTVAVLPSFLVPCTHQLLTCNSCFENVVFFFSWKDSSNTDSFLCRGNGSLFKTKGNVISKFCIVIAWIHYHVAEYSSLNAACGLCMFFVLPWAGWLIGASTILQTEAKRGVVIAIIMRVACWLSASTEQYCWSSEEGLAGTPFFPIVLTCTVLDNLTSERWAPTWKVICGSVVVPGDQSIIAESANTVQLPCNCLLAALL